MNFEACYRLGPYKSGRTRPILVCFERQCDRDLIYSRRMDLKRLTDFQHVWINEDLNPASKRKRNMIKLITRDTQEQGIDCRTGKYAIHIGKTKYDESNLNELPPQLQPASLKQIKIDENTLAYQSKFAPLSNFYNCTIVIGKHRFVCAEQAFQFLKAKTLNKHLIATKIYLSRDVRYIKQLGGEIGTSAVW